MESYVVLFAPNQAPKQQPRVVITDAHSTMGAIKPANLVAAAQALSAKYAISINHGPTFTAYVSQETWGSASAGQLRNTGAEAVLNLLQKNFEYGQEDARLYGPVLVAFVDRNAYQATLEDLSLRYARVLTAHYEQEARDTQKEWVVSEDGQSTTGLSAVKREDFERSLFRPRPTELFTGNLEQVRAWMSANPLPGSEDHTERLLAAQDQQQQQMAIAS